MPQRYRTVFGNAEKRRYVTICIWSVRGRQPGSMPAERNEQKTDKLNVVLLYFDYVRICIGGLFNNLRTEHLHFV